jgi:hypothetical protein
MRTTPERLDYLWFLGYGLESQTAHRLSSRGDSPITHRAPGTNDTKFLAVVSSPLLECLCHHISQCHRFKLDIGSCIEVIDPRFNYRDTIG